MLLSSLAQQLLVLLNLLAYHPLGTTVNIILD